MGSASPPLPSAAAPTSLLCILRVHARPLLTKICLHELDAYAHLSPSLSVRVLIQADRPSPDVARLLASDLPACVSDIQHLPYPILDRHGEHYLDAQNDAIDLAEEGEPFDWAFLCDDDRWLEPRAAYARLLPALRVPGVTAYNIESLFFSGHTNTYTLTRSHASPLLWKHTPGARFSGRRMINVPDDILDAATIRDTLRNLDIPLLDYGTFTPAEARRVYDAFFLAGKDDAYTRSALLPPDLRVFPTQFSDTYGPWLDRASEFGFGKPLT